MISDVVLKQAVADGNLKKVSIPPRALSNRRSVDEWAEVIANDFNHAVEGIVAAGQHLRDAKDQLDHHGEWLPLLQRVGINERTAQRFMKIAANEVLANPTHWVGFPTFWRTLSEMATLPTDILEAKIADGTITPKTTRAEIAALKGKSRQGRPKKGAGQAVLSQHEIAVPYDGIGRQCEFKERIAELEAEIDALRARIAELEGGEVSQPDGAMAAVRVIEPMTEEDRQELERAGQQRLPFEWEIGADAACVREAVA
jgi:hypothetical protein